MMKTGELSWCGEGGSAIRPCQGLILLLTDEHSSKSRLFAWNKALRVLY